MRPLLSIAILASTLALSSAAAADPSVGPSATGWHLTRASYVALGSGGTSAGGNGKGRREHYAASGFDVRGISTSGHGGFARMEEGTAAWFNPAAAQDPHVMALDLGYTFGGPLLGAWGDGLLGFLELGVTGWHASNEPVGDFDQTVHVGDGSISGFGVAYGATVEGRLAGMRLGVALQRRDVPFLLDRASASGYATSTTLQLRLQAEL